MKGDAAYPIDRSPIHLLHRAYQAVDHLFDAGMKTNGLTARQLAVLITVSQNEGLSQTDLTEHTGIDRSTLADVVKRLKRKGLLQRRRTKEDARAYAVRLTEEASRSCGRRSRWQGASTGGYSMLFRRSGVRNSWTRWRRS
jgi:MarR family transcriptional regulator, temperature-dependent positive regulator of motility